ncbi:MAG: pyridoxamine kinase [Clostridia bacterium]|nr:pyridoxamine kinase [Clostridia bacterium]
MKTSIKRVAAINDLSGLGRCSLTAAIPVLSALGIQPCPVPTAVLTNQTGFASYHLWECEKVFETFTCEWKRRGVRPDGIFTGFLTSEAQAEAVQAFIREFRTEDTLVLIDPVMADDGQRYGLFSESFCERMRKLALCADVLTPNLTELCLLTGADFAEQIAHANEPDYLDRIAALGDRLIAQGVSAVLVTGVHVGDLVYNVVCEKERRAFVPSPCLGGSYSGTGDLFAAATGGLLLHGFSAEQATRLTAHFLEASLADTVAAGTDRHEGVCFEPYLHLLTEAVQHGKE